MAEEQNIIQDIVEEAAEKLSCLLEQYATEPFYVKITGYKPQEIAQMLASRPSAQKPDSITSQHGYTMTSDDIKGPVDVRIREGSAIPLDKNSKIALLKDLGQTYLEMQGRPAGPFIKALGKMIVEEAGLHELTMALEQEAVFQAQQQKAAQAQQEKQQQMMIGQKSAELQMQAQELDNKKSHNDSTNQIKLLNMMKEIQLTLAQMQNDRAIAENDSGAE